MSQDKIAVLGANSFAGAAFVAHAVRRGYEVLGFSRSAEGSPIFLPYRAETNAGAYSFVQADINTDLDALFDHLSGFKPAYVVDFAGQSMVAESWAAPEDWYQTNIVSKTKFHMRLRGADWLEKYVKISTPEVYGSTDALIPESWAFNPTTPYAVSQAAIDLSLRCYHQTFDFPVVFTRFANFYGPGQQLYRIVPRTIIRALTGEKLQLHGGGKSVRAFIYGDDVADGIIRVLKQGDFGEVYHFSPQRFVTIREAVEMIVSAIGADFDKVVEVAADRPGKDQAYLMSGTKAEADLGWREATSLEAGIEKTTQWVRDNLGEIQALPQDYTHKA